MSEEVIIVPDDVFEFYYPYSSPVEYSRHAWLPDPDLTEIKYRYLVSRYDFRTRTFPSLMLPDARIVMVRHASDKEKVFPENSPPA